MKIKAKYAEIYDRDGIELSDGSHITADGSNNYFQRIPKFIKMVLREGKTKKQIIDYWIDNFKDRRTCFVRFTN